MQKYSSLQPFCAEVLASNLAALAQEIEGVREARDPEYIHRMRVATRRLRNALTLFAELLPQKKRERWYQQIRNVARSLGMSRDLDVQIEFLNEFCKEIPEPRKHLPGFKRLVLRITQKRASLQVNVNQSLDNLVKSSILPEMQTLADAWQHGVETQKSIPLELYLLARDSIVIRLDEVLGYDEFIYDPERIVELHAMRKAAKWLRYTLETYQTIYQEESKTYLQVLKKTQDMLGFIHDCDVWAAFLPQFIEKEKKRVIKFYGYPSPFYLLRPGLQYFLENRQFERQSAYTNFLSQWSDWKNGGLWDRLRHLVEVPF